MKYSPGLKSIRFSVRVGLIIAMQILWVVVDLIETIS